MKYINTLKYDDLLCNIMICLVGPRSIHFCIVGRSVHFALWGPVVFILYFGALFYRKEFFTTGRDALLQKEIHHYIMVVFITEMQSAGPPQGKKTYYCAPQGKINTTGPHKAQ